jgi:GntR family transcriptional regulator
MPKDGTIHQKLIDILRALMRSGAYEPGSQFLTEREIAERFRTSRPTANKALSSLVSEGLLEVRRGAGTFVREAVLDYDLERLVSFTDKARAVGMMPGTELLAFCKLAASDSPPHMVRSLGVSENDELIYMERIRMADRKPVIYERRHVVGALCEAMTRADCKGSLYAYWTEKCGLTITGADEVIHAVNATKTQAAHLRISPGTACFQIIATGFVAGDRPLWHEETLYRADAYEFRNRISGIAGTRAAMGRIIAPVALPSRR